MGAFFNKLELGGVVMIYDLIIVGAGASGAFAAIAAHQREEKSKILVLERNEAALKKILATGNGRCNLSNCDMSPEKYNHPHAFKQVYQQFDWQATKACFSALGLYTTTEDDGRIFPYSLEAKSVVQILKRALEKVAEVKYGAKAERIRKEKDHFL